MCVSAINQNATVFLHFTDELGCELFLKFLTEEKKAVLNEIT